MMNSIIVWHLMQTETSFEVCLVLTKTLSLVPLFKAILGARGDYSELTFVNR